jgi:hypothetical protein
MKCLQMANAGDNPVEAKSNSDINDLLAEMRDEGLIKFRPNNKISRHISQWSHTNYRLSKPLIE